MGPHASYVAWPPARDQDVAVPESRPESCLFCGAAQPRGGALELNTACGRCASPLYPAVRRRIEPSGQRMLNRVSRDSPVRIWTHWRSREELPALMRNVSLNGMQLLAEAPLHADQIVKIDANFCRCVARVAHCRAWEERGWIIGVEFVTLQFTQLQGNFVSTRV